MIGSGRCGWLLALMLGLSLTRPAVTQGGFVVTDLGVAGPGQATGATGIGDSGAIAGQLERSDGTYALRSTGGGTFKAIDTSGLTGINPAGLGATPYSTTAGISAGGNAVGTYLDSIDGQYHAFATAGSKAVDYGTFNGAATVGAAINSGGTVLATAYQFGSTSAVRMTGPGAGAAISLPVGGSDGIARGLNDAGTAVGNYTDARGSSRIFLSGAGGGTINLLAGYAMPGFGANSYATGIASNNDVAGYGQFGNQFHAFLVTAPRAGGTGRFIDIGTTGGFSSSQALGLNSLGQVVGEMDSAGFSAHAFVYDSTYGLFDLNSLLTGADSQNWVLSSATGINNQGQIVGQGIINGQVHGFLLTPTAGDLIFGPSIVPTPPSLVLAAAGMALLGGWLRFRRGQTAGPETA